MNDELKKYIDEHVLPEYSKNEEGHGIEHINYVIKRSFEIIDSNKLKVNPNIVYVIASYHDIAHHIDPKNHEILSAQIMSNDNELKKFFNEEELNIIKEAIEYHRASSNHEPRSIYGKIVSTADRNNTVEDCLKRSYIYNKKHNPNDSDDEILKKSYEHLKSKFGDNGYAKFFFKDEKYEQFLKEFRELLKDEKVFYAKQKEYINSLKEKGIIR